MPLSYSSQRGVGMMEILITLLVLSVGLLGAAQLQLLGLNDAQASRARINATLIAYDLADRMRANKIAFSLLKPVDNPYLTITASEGVQSPEPDAPGCSVSGCTPGQQAARDVREWLENLTDITGIAADGSTYQPILPNATAHLSEAAGARLVLVLTWQEINRNSKALVTHNYTQEIKL